MHPDIDAEVAVHAGCHNQESPWFKNRALPIAGSERSQSARRGTSLRLLDLGDGLTDDAVKPMRGVGHPGRRWARRIANSIRRE